LASLHKDPRGRSPCWYCAYRLGDGRRTLRSTGETNLQRANIKCHAMARIAEEESRGDTSRELLEGIVNDTLRRLGRDSIARPTARGWLEKWLSTERGAVTELTLEKYAQVVRDFLGSLGTRANLRLSAIGEEDIVRFRDQLLAGGRSASTVNLLVRAILKRPFRIAVESGIIQRNPVALVRAIQGTSGQKGTFTPEQIAQIVATAEGDWKGLTLAGWYTGARLGDLAKLQWSSVDLVEQTITFEQTKTKRIVRIPIHPDLEAWLRLRQNPGNPGNPRSGRSSCGAVFPTLCGKLVKGESGLSRSFARLVAKAGIDSGKIRARSGIAGRSVTKLSFHSLRHSFNSFLANSGVSQELRQMLTGHASPQINDKYTHLKMASLREAINTLPKLG
jgi:integrase